MLAYKNFYPERYIAFGGQSRFYDFFDRTGPDAINRESIVDDPEFKENLASLRRSLEKKEIVGIGELFVNNQRSHPQGKKPIKMFPVSTYGPDLRL